MNIAVAVGANWGAHFILGGVYTVNQGWANFHSSLIFMQCWYLSCTKCGCIFSLPVWVWSGHLFTHVVSGFGPVFSSIQCPLKLGGGLWLEQSFVSWLAHWIPASPCGWWFDVADCLEVVYRVSAVVSRSCFHLLIIVFTVDTAYHSNIDYYNIMYYTCHMTPPKCIIKTTVFLSIFCRASTSLQCM